MRSLSLIGRAAFFQRAIVVTEIARAVTGLEWANSNFRKNRASTAVRKVA